MRYDFSEQNNEQLPAIEVELKTQIDALEAFLRSAKASLQAVKDEQVNRQLARYFKTHPELTAFKKGDLVKITSEAKEYKENEVRQGILYDIGANYVVKDVWFDFDDYEWLCYLKETVNMVSGSLFRDIAMVSRMRKAYLESMEE